ncbi:type VI secretion system lipoprotein TssJ [Burkholderia sp. JSH-S8]|nr:type VI secretion system lipoprotein TssJ [Burkholderia sp. JSH-S8]
MLGKFALVGLCVWQTACGAGPVRKESVNLRLRVVASEQVNADERDRAAPIMVRIYELKSATAFENADYFTLQNDDRKVLGDDALVVDEFILRPGDTREIRRKSNPSTTAIGVLAGYRLLGQSVWRDVYRAPPAPNAAWYRAVIADRTLNLTVRIEGQAASISSQSH